MKPAQFHLQFTSPKSLRPSSLLLSNLPVNHHHHHLGTGISQSHYQSCTPTHWHKSRQTMIYQLGWRVPEGKMRNIWVGLIFFCWPNIPQCWEYEKKMRSMKTDRKQMYKGVWETSSFALLPAPLSFWPQLNSNSLELFPTCTHHTHHPCTPHIVWQQPIRLSVLGDWWVPHPFTVFVLHPQHCPLSIRLLPHVVLDLHCLV